VIQKEASAPVYCPSTVSGPWRLYVAWGGTGSSGLCQWTSHLSRLHTSATQESSTDVLPMLQTLRLWCSWAYLLIVRDILLVVCIVSYHRIMKTEDLGVRTAVTMKNTVFWNATQLVERNGCDSVVSGIRLPTSLLTCTAYSSTLKMESVRSYETSV
jgi:hypothetical protein